VTGIKLRVESPLFVNLEVVIVTNNNKSTSRRQGLLREEGSEGSPMAKVRDDGQKPHRRLSPWASRHNTSKPTVQEIGKCSGLAWKVHALILGDLRYKR
jgi:hypothetical protein